MSGLVWSWALHKQTDSCCLERERDNGAGSDSLPQQAKGDYYVQPNAADVQETGHLAAAAAVSRADRRYRAAFANRQTEQRPGQATGTSACNLVATRKTVATAVKVTYDLKRESRLLEQGPTSESVGNGRALAYAFER